jgi:hypothetical protein
LQLVVKLETQNGLWQDIVKAKYFRHGTVASIKPRVSDSPCWKAIMKVKDDYFRGRKVILHKGDIVRFWLDPWLNDTPLCLSHQELYDISQGQDFTFASFAGVNFEVPFRRRLSPELTLQWEQIRGSAELVV